MLRSKADVSSLVVLPLSLPEMQLDRDLVEAIHAGNEAALQLQARHHNGEFDASTEESDDWAESPDGKAVLALLTKDITR